MGVRQELGMECWRIIKWTGMGSHRKAANKSTADVRMDLGMAC